MKTLLISLFITLSLMSCGEQSGIQNGKSESIDCGVKDPTLSDTSKIIPRTETEISGQKLFTLHCQQCHALLKIQPGNGRSLQGILYRIPGPPEKYFAAFINDSYALKQSGDAYAHKLDELGKSDYEHTFKNILNDKEIGDIIEYIKLAN